MAICVGWVQVLPVKSWVRESRDRRRVLLTQLREAIRGRKGEALPVVRKFENHQVNVREPIAASLSDPHGIARAQLERFRRQLSTLAREQGIQIEDLLASTLTRISLMTGRSMESQGREFCKEGDHGE